GVALTGRRQPALRRAVGRRRQRRLEVVRPRGRHVRPVLPGGRGTGPVLPGGRSARPVLPGGRSARPVLAGGRGAQGIPVAVMGLRGRALRSHAHPWKSSPMPEGRLPGASEPERRHRPSAHSAPTGRSCSLLFNYPFSPGFWTLVAEVTGTL